MAKYHLHVPLEEETLKLKIDQYQPKTKNAYKRWLLKCSHHRACEKKRSLALTRTWGSVEPVAFLAAWNEMGATMDREQHKLRSTNPSGEDVARFAAKVDKGSLDNALAAHGGGV